MPEQRTGMGEAEVLAAQCWCDKETEDIEMDPALHKAVAKRIAVWMDTAAQNQRNSDYYRGLLEKCGKAIGKQAYIIDDGTVTEDVRCAKIPELVNAVFRKMNKKETPRIPVWKQIRKMLNI